jgi:hypothetical protein
LASKYIALPYDKEKESLQYVSISEDNHLLLVKRTQNIDAENLLEVLKYNITTGGVDKAQFSINSNLFVEPGMLYNSSDSTTIVYSLVRGPISTLSGKASLVCKLDKFMQPVIPATLLNYSSHYSFFLLKDVHEKWINFSNNFLNQLPSGNYMTARIINNSFWTNYYYQNQPYPYYDIGIPRNQPRDYYGNTNDYIHITRISIMNREFKVLKNRFLTYRTDPDYKILEGYGMFEWKNRSYLLLKQQLPSKSKGLLLVTGMQNKDINVSELHVYNRYDFLLKQMQYIGNGNIIIPYINKREVGLMKLKFD